MSLQGGKGMARRVRSQAKGKVPALTYLPTPWRSSGAWPHSRKSTPRRSNNTGRSSSRKTNQSARKTSRPKRRTMP